MHAIQLRIEQNIFIFSLFYKLNEMRQVSTLTNDYRCSITHLQSIQKYAF